MSNHYHLLIETPRANLDRIMRHINGLYTQRYNLLKNTDGPLFRGRYKAIVVDQDAYLLQLTRYIHRNPIETKTPMVKRLEDHRWSSYPAYLNQVKAVPCLYLDKTYQMLGHRNRYAAYQAYIEEGIDQETRQFYSKGNIGGVLGDERFRKTLLRKKKTLKPSTDLARRLSVRPSAEAIVKITAKVFNTDIAAIYNRRAGRQVANMPRKIAIYYCQQYGDLSLQTIAGLFGLSHQSSVSPAIYDVKVLIKAGKNAKELETMDRYLSVIK